MTFAKKFAETRNAKTGEVVMQLFGPGADTDPLSIGLRILTHQLKLHDPAREHGGGLFGGEYGYGVKFENDTFMMHPFCWCERDDCLWCRGRCGCGEPYDVCRYLDGRRVSQAEYDAWHNTIEKPLPWHATASKHGTSEYSKHQKAFDAYIEERDRRSGRIWPPVVHTCGHKMFFDQTTEIWAVYAPTPYPHSAPHFWHKSSGLRVWWYKYIGRDTIVSGYTDLIEMLSDCLGSFGGPSLELAVNAYVEAEKKSATDARQAMDFWMSDKGRTLTDKMIADGTIITFGFGKGTS